MRLRVAALVASLASAACGTTSTRHETSSVAEHRSGTPRPTSELGTPTLRARVFEDTLVLRAVRPRTCVVDVVVETRTTVRGTSQVGGAGRAVEWALLGAGVVVAGIGAAESRGCNRADASGGCFDGAPQLLLGGALVLGAATGLLVDQAVAGSTTSSDEVRRRRDETRIACEDVPMPSALLEIRFREGTVEARTDDDGRARVLLPQPGPGPRSTKGVAVSIDGGPAEVVSLPVR